MPFYKFPKSSVLQLPDRPLRVTVIIVKSSLNEASYFKVIDRVLFHSPTEFASGIAHTERKQHCFTFTFSSGVPICTLYTVCKDTGYEFLIRKFYFHLVK